MLAYVAGDDVKDAHSVLGLIGDRVGEPGRDDTIEARERSGGSLRLSNNESVTLCRNFALGLFEWRAVGVFSRCKTP